MQSKDTTADRILRENISAIREMHRQSTLSSSSQIWLANTINRFAGSMTFVYAHIIWFGVWFVVNTGLLANWGIAPIDPYPFGLLTVVVSLEAIFLSTFVLISQNQLAVASAREAALDLQINLLAEQQAVKIIEMLEQMIEQMNAMDNSFQVMLDPQLAALKHAPTPLEVAQVLDEQIKEAETAHAQAAAAVNPPRR